VIGAQPLQRVGGGRLDSGRASVITEPVAVRSALGAELDAQPVGVPVAALERAGDQHLVVAHPVEVAGVDQGDPASSAASMVAVLSASSAGPYGPDIPMQPRPAVFDLVLNAELLFGELGSPAADVMQALNIGRSRPRPHEMISR